MNLWEKNMQHLKNIFRYIKERLLCITVILFILILLLFVIIRNATLITPEQYESQQMLIAGISLENWSILIGIVGVGFTAMWTMFQYSKNKLLSQQEKASNIASEFANELVEKLYVINKVLLSNNEYSELLEKINIDNLKSFTYYEITQLTKDKDIFSKFNKIVFSDQIQTAYEELLKSRHNAQEIELFESKFPILIQNTLNRLEFISMNISSTAAGSQFIYPSLHQMFLNTVYVLSPSIAENNYNNVDKFFINIIQVYNHWNAEKEKDAKYFEKNRKKHEKRSKKYKEKQQKEMKKLLDKNPREV